MAQNAQGRREIRPAKADAAKRAIVESLEQGASRQGACEAAQVARRTFYNWLAEDEAFAERVAEAEAQIDTTVAAGIVSPQDAAEFIDLTREQTAILETIRVETGIRKSLNLDTLTVIWALAPGGPAQVAGLQVGDQIIAVDGQPAISRNRIKRYASVSVTLTLRRAGRPEPFEATLTRVPVEGAVRDFHVSDVHEAHDGSLWFVLYEGEVVCYDPHTGPADAAAWRLYTASDGVELGWSPRITQTRDGAIWAISGDASAAVNRFDGVSWAPFRLSSLGSNDSNTAILETRDGTLWIGGFALHAFRDGVWTVYQHLEKTIPAHRTQLLEASDGALWVMGMGEGAARLAYRSPRWTTYEGLTFQHETRDGTRWFVASDGGVVRYADGTWTRYGVEDGLMTTPTVLMAMREGALWAAGSHRGTAATAQFDGNAWSTQTPPNVSSSIYGNAVFQASDGALWFGAGSSSLQGGVLRFHPSPPPDEQPWRHYAHPQAPPYVYGIGEMPDGVLWFGGHQLYRFDGATWTPMAHPDALSSFVTDIERARDRGLWVGTRLHGVFHFDGEHWTIGGGVTISSSPGQGTCIDVVFPLSKQRGLRSREVRR